MTEQFALVGMGMSDRYRLNSDGDSTPPCGTPVQIIRFLEVYWLYCVYTLRPLR